PTASGRSSSAAAAATSARSCCATSSLRPATSWSTAGNPQTPTTPSPPRTVTNTCAGATRRRFTTTRSSASGRSRASGPRRRRRPVPINTELLLRAELESSRGRRVRVRGALVDGDEALAEARAAFVHVPLEHFLATPEGRASADAWLRRLEEKS